MKSITYLRSKSDSFVALLKKKNKAHDELLIQSSNFCESCEEMTYQIKKLHKCNGCGKRVICSICHDDNKDICKICDEELMSLYAKIEMSFNSLNDKKIEDFVDQFL